MIKNIPDSIFLQVGDAGDCNYSELKGITFHHKKVFENDIEYINADIVDSIINAMIEFKKATDGIE